MQLIFFYQLHLLKERLSLSFWSYRQDYMYKHALKWQMFFAIVVGEYHYVSMISEMFVRLIRLVWLERMIAL